MTKPILSVHDLSVVFPDDNGGLCALDRLSFEVMPHEFVCFLGPSGAGKTTLLRVLAGLLKPESGRVNFIRTQRPKIGMVFQQANLMPWRTVFDNIKLPLELEGMGESKAALRVKEMIELVGLQGFENSLPKELSGGMAQRVGLARALAHDPDVLLLDEPFGSLDSFTRERMWTEFLRIWQTKRKTVIMVTHSINESLFLADRALVLSSRPGRVKFELKVDLPRPRDDDMRYTAHFGKLAKKLRGEMGNG